MLLPELVAYIDAQTARTAGVDLFYGQLPATPDAVVAVLETPGAPPVPRLGGAGAILNERPRVQVLVRHPTHDTGRQWAEDVMKALVGVLDTTLSGTRYVSIEALTTPFVLERDGNDRWIWACNFQVDKGPSAS